MSAFIEARIDGRKKPRENVEEQLHRAIWQHIKLRAPKNVIAYHPANGGSRSKRTAGRLKAMGVVPGIPDLAFVLADGRAAFMEIKKPGGRIAPEQKAFAAKCLAMNVPHALVADIDSALAALIMWGILPSPR